ncbi:unnamed protein product, partial [Owenia fusiformis]
ITKFNMAAKFSLFRVMHLSSNSNVFRQMTKLNAIFECSSIGMLPGNRQHWRNFNITSVKSLKEIQEKTEGNVTKIEGVYRVSDSTKHLIFEDQSSDPEVQRPCPIWSLGPIAEKIRYTDVLILSQFLRPDGTMLPKRVTGLCRDSQKKILRLVGQAQRAGLMTSLRPPKYKDGQVVERTAAMNKYKFKKFNKYFTDDFMGTK